MAKALVNSDGKVLVTGGKVATDDCPGECCGGAGGCSLPDGDCPHAICFEVMVDASEVSAGTNSDFIDLYGGLWGPIGDYVDYGDSQWIAYGSGGGTGSGTVAISDLNSFAGVWHSIVLQFTSNGTDVDCVLSVDGVSSASFVAITGSGTQTLTTLQAGSLLGGPAAHRSIRNITLLANPGSDSESDIPVTAFDGFTGSTISLTDGVLRVDNDASEDVYGSKNIPYWNVTCACAHIRISTGFEGAGGIITNESGITDALCEVDFPSNLPICVVFFPTNPDCSDTTTITFPAPHVAFCTGITQEEISGSVDISYQLNPADGTYQVSVQWHFNAVTTGVDPTTCGCHAFSTQISSRDNLGPSGASFTDTYTGTGYNYTLRTDTDTLLVTCT